MRRTLCLILLASVTALVMTDESSAAALRKKHPHKIVYPQSIGVVVDQAKMVSLSRPAKTIYIGNPTIADITVIDSRHAFVLGKTFGVTNLIAMDAQGKQISNQQVTVVNGFEAVTFNEGNGQYNYSCTRAHCESMPRPGDVTAFVTNTEQAVSTHEEAGTKNASGAGSSGTPIAQ
jgi:hypothetical protein